MTLTLASDDLNLLWATPIHVRQLAGAEELNARLESEILDLQAVDPGAPRTSNYGGWESNDDLFDLDLPGLAELQSLCAQAVGDCVAEISRGSTVEIEVSLLAWANVVEKGAYHTFHTHPDNHFSGVYVVRAGEPDPGNDHSGVLCFYEPRPGAAMTYFRNLGFGEDFEVTPRDGMLLLFPAFLGHSVHPFTGAGKRITVAFNARLVD